MKKLLVLFLLIMPSNYAYSQIVAPQGTLVTSALPEDKSPASVSGIVLRAGTTEPMRGAQVELVPADVGTLADYDYNPAILNVLKGRHKTYAIASNNSGAFMFAEVLPGRYRLSAIHDGFNRTEYLQRGSNDRGAVIEISPGARVADLTIAMAPAPTISGIVTDENGIPAAYASVEAFALQYFPGGSRRLRLVQTADANDLGEYRLYWMSPGDYYIAVEYKDGGARHEVFGGVPQERPNVPLPEVAYPTFYYPGTPDLAGAQTIHLSESGDVPGINFRLREAPLATLRGAVTNLPSSSIKPGEVQILLAPIALADGGFSYNYRSDAQGKFEILGVAPGSYLMKAVGRSANVASRSSVVRVEVGSKDVENLEIPLGPSLAVRGRVQVDGSPGNLPFDTSAVIPQLIGAVGHGELITGRLSGDGAYTTPDGGFPGTFQVSFLGLPEGYYLKQVQQGSKDVFESGVQLGGENALSIDMILGRNTKAVAGTVTGLDNKPAWGAIVVLVPSIPYRNRADRYLRAVSDAQGRFNIGGAPPGTYTAYAFDEVLSDSFFSPEFLRRYSGRGIDVSVSDLADTIANPKLIQVER